MAAQDRSRGAIGRARLERRRRGASAGKERGKLQREAGQLRRAQRVGAAELERAVMRWATAIACIVRVACPRSHHSL